ncbi:MAG TPA: thioredoxin domain-containing protein [Myxococcota bacterium]|nr:thioredoxin domain-containing protein [Myxococcota bacterium]
MANRLAAETSAYLRQHAHNPVDWYPWGDEAWERARRESKPVLVSIGYSSCHWCHVMERESFEDPNTARLMNDLVIAIKVDREERPDVDQIYMEAVQRMTGSGGWPLNMFCTPDGRPFMGGTYFPPRRMHNRPSFAEVVLAVSRAFKEQREEVDKAAAEVLASLGARPEVTQPDPPGKESLALLVRQVMARADRRHGGFGAAPKFPTATNLEAVLAASQLGVARGDALEHLGFSLEKMARGGIFDQLGGGFHRYSTDERWLVPHFEKMLYDNGQLLRVYAEAFRQTGDAKLAWPVEETVAWLEREMRDPAGGFYASQDADSEGEEGRFFVWSPDEIRAVLGPELGDEFCAAYGVEPGGNFEHSGKSVLSHGLAGERPRYAEARAKLLQARAARIPPATDRKNVCSWIGYAISGLALAGSVHGRPEWIAGAARAADFVLTRLSQGGRELLRIYEAGEAKIPAFLDDYAALLGALLDLHRAGAGDRYLESALVVAGELRTRFFEARSGELFFTPGGDRTLVMRPTSDSDGATPSASGLSVLELCRLASLTGRAELRELVDAVIAREGPVASRAPLYLPTLVRAAALRDAELGVAIVLGPPDDPRTQGLAARARMLLGPEDAVAIVTPGAPPAWLAAEWLEGRELRNGAPTAYVCRGRVCSLPANQPDELALP